MKKDNNPQYNSKVMNWIEYRLPVFSFLDHSLGTQYPAPKNLNYWWNFGAIAGICLMIQILTGLFLAMQYTPQVDLAFDSVERIMRDVNYGWLLRYMHAVGASMFFVVVYIHIFRGLYYGSYKAPREVLWWLGVVILLLMMATAFMGYVLPWGQMSLWGAKVITNLFSSIPLVGEDIVVWLWGGFSVDNPTLNRFYALHFLLPFVIVGVVVLHIWALHTHGSNNPTGLDVQTDQDTIPFHPYYTIKDIFSFGIFFIIFAAFVFFSPNSLGHPDNYIPANPMVTPPHIVPEWYFLPFYAILRAITFPIPLMLPVLAALGAALWWLNPRLQRRSLPAMLMAGTAIIVALAICVIWGYVPFINAKLGGVLMMFGAIAILFALPWIDRSPVRSAAFRPTYRILFWIFVVDCILLGYAGSQAADWGTLITFCSGAECSDSKAWIAAIPFFSALPDITISLLAALYYFFHFFLVGYLTYTNKEKTLPLPQSISAAVLQKKGAGA